MVKTEIMDALIKKSFQKWLVIIVLGVIATIAGFVTSQFEQAIQLKNASQNSISAPPSK